MSTLTVTHTRTHTEITFANPHLVCDECGVPVPAFHDRERCGCDDPTWNIPCGHIGVHSVCQSWGPVDGCCCMAQLGHVPHPALT